MVNVREIWYDFKRRFPNTIALRCTVCETNINDDAGIIRCSTCDKRSNIHIFALKQEYSDSSGGWIKVRERPSGVDQQIIGLCPERNCRKGSKKCKQGHSKAELQLWEVLRNNSLYLSDFRPRLIFTDGVDYSQPARVATNNQSTKKKRKRQRRHTSSSVASYQSDNSSYENKNGVAYFVNTKCGGGRFLFACEACYKLKPHIVKEMQIGKGKGSHLHCTWCNKSRGIFFHEKKFVNSGGVTFYEYERIRERKSTSKASSLCRYYVQGKCENEDCTFAHSYMEVQVWKQEANNTSRKSIVEFCNARAPNDRPTLNGMFHCEFCCLSFSDNDEYVKYMGQNHENHFSEIRRQLDTWTFQKYTGRELELCSHGDDCPLQMSCNRAHHKLELEEWKENIQIDKARQSFVLTEVVKDYISLLRLKIQEKRLQSIEQLSGIQVQVGSKTKRIDMETEKIKWKLKLQIADTNLSLKHVTFVYGEEFEIRHLDQSHYKYHVELDKNMKTNLEFMVLFTNPTNDMMYYGEHVGELVFDFGDEHDLVNLLFHVNVQSDGVNLPPRNLQENWILDRKIIKHPMLLNQSGKFNTKIEELKKVYNPPKKLDKFVDFQDIEKLNYAQKMHDLLYKEEEARRGVLAKLNIDCDLQISSPADGSLLARFELPLNVSTDEVLLFKETCNTVLVGKKLDMYAYEAKILSQNETEIIINLSPNCVKDLNIQEGKILLQIQFQLDRSLFCLMHYAVDCLKDKTSLICPAVGNYVSLKHDTVKEKCQGLDNLQSAVYDYLQWQKENRSYNKKKSYPPLIVAGPFGTGKTHTIKNILLELIKKNDSEATILLCTHTNSAADSYLEDRRFEQWIGKVLRLVYHDRKTSAVKETVRRYCIIKNGAFCYPSLVELRKYKLVIATFSSVMALSIETGLEENVFTHIFLDEASQAMEAEVIMPLTLASLENTRVVIAGDHKQLTQRMYCDSSHTIQTLLERMYEDYENVDKRCRVLLTNNYRCVEGILQLITKIFYKENILKKCGNIECLPMAKPVYFLHVQGFCIPHGEEYVNKEEAMQIMLEIKTLNQKLVELKDIVVLAAFYKQVVLIRSILRENGLKEVSVQTVRNVQGQQYKVVILSTVMRRSNCFGGENFGFLSDSRSLNSALTRASSMILAVGDAVTLCSTGDCKKYWKLFLKQCEDEHSILPPSVNVESIKRDIQIADQKLNISAAEFTPGVTSENFEQRSEVNNQYNQEAEQVLEESNGNTQDTSMEDDEDDNDSWCSDEGEEDRILDDMLKRIGFDPSRVTVDVGKQGQEFIQYGEREEFDGDDDDPNDGGRFSRTRSRQREAIYPKYTMQQLQELLKNGEQYKRCQIRMINWCTAKAIPVDDEVKNDRKNTNLGKLTVKTSDTDSTTQEEDSESESDAYSLEDDSENETEMQQKQSTALFKPADVSPVILIETRWNLGRTFDKDEVLVQILKNATAGSQSGITQKRYGKVLGVLKKRFRNPKDRRFLCRPDEFNSAMMCPFDRKVTKILTITPKGHKQSPTSKINIYRPTVKRGQWTDLKHLGAEEVSHERVYVVRYLKWSEYCPYPLGFVESSFPLSDFRQYLKLEYGVPGEHRPGLRNLAKRLKVPTTKEKPIEVFTIDPPKSMDLDDAISLKKCDAKDHKDCYQIGIHITDVASVLPEGSEIDRDAQKRFTTFYGCEDETPVHMLPSELSTEKFSLLPNKIRPAISTYFHSCEKSPHSPEFIPKEPEKTFIKSIRRLNYREAEDLMRRVDDNGISAEDAELANTLDILWSLMWDWRVSRLDGEAYYKNTDSYRDMIDECRAHLLIEEAMISVNSNTASFLSQKGFEFPMRIQEIPDEGEWTGWEKLCHNLIPNSSYMSSCSKYLKKLKNIEEGADVNDAEISENEEENGGEWETAQSRRRKRKEKKKRVDEIQLSTSIQPLASIRLFQTYWRDMETRFEKKEFDKFSFLAATDDLHPSLLSTVDRYRGIQKKSDMTTKKDFHFSLRLEKYTWSSSPIRRYIDIVIQRCIHTILDDKNSSRILDDAIQRICWQYDDRDKQYQKNLKIAKIAEDLKKQPQVAEACVTLITDAYLQIALPSLRRYISHRATELYYANLTIKQGSSSSNNVLDTLDEKAKIRTSQDDLILDKYNLIWRFRRYDHSRFESEKRDSVQSVSLTVKIPVQTWKSFVKLISKPPTSSASEFTKVNHERDLEEVATRMVDEAESERDSTHDRMCGATRNNPKPIKHLREIRWNVTPGSPLTVQLSASTDKKSLSTPAVQLLSIANDYDICIEHSRDPVNVYARDAESTLDKTAKTIEAYQRKWEPLVRMDAANSAVKDGCSITHDGVKVLWGKTKKVGDVQADGFGDIAQSRYCTVNYFDLKAKFCQDRYIKFHHGDLLCLRLKGVPTYTDNSVDSGQAISEYNDTKYNTYTVVVHGIISSVKEPSKDSKSEDSKSKNVRVCFDILHDNMSDKARLFANKKGTRWTVEVIPLSFSHRQMKKALQNIGQTSDLIKSICLGTVHPEAIKLPDEIEQNIASKRKLKGFEFPLNEEQFNQEQKAIKSSFSLIQGPPGTGKSYMAAHMAARFAYINKNMGGMKKVLYCGPSNKSVDVAAGFLKDIKGLRVVRMYSSGLEEKLYPNPLKPEETSLDEEDGKKPDEKLQNMALHELIRKMDHNAEAASISQKICEIDSRVKSLESIFSRNEMDHYQVLIRKAKCIVLKSCDVIICTCSSSTKLSDYEDLEFGQCIVDECAMSCEPETILPLVATEPDQVVLIGDHKQLRPVIKCAAAERLGLSNSLFQRYSEFAGMLTNQYRMHRTIMDFPSEMFYENKLTCDQSVEKRKPDILDPFKWIKNSAAIFWDVKGEEKIQNFKSVEGGEKSKYNMAEVWAVVKLLERLTSKKISKSRIMIISPYTAQCARIREHIRKNHNHLRDVHVGTVVTSQGSEADYVILSTVRSLPDSSIIMSPNVQWLRRNLGFLIDANQVNVALTRARRRLFIIGNRNLLQVDELWRKLLNSYEQKRAIFGNNLLDPPQYRH